MKVEIYSTGGLHMARVLLDGEEIPVTWVRVDGKVGEAFAVTLGILARDLAVMIQDGFWPGIQDGVKVQVVTPERGSKCQEGGKS